MAIKLLHHIALRLQAEFNHRFVVVNDFGVIVFLIYCHPKTFSVLGTEGCYLIFSTKKCPLAHKLLR